MIHFYHGLFGSPFDWAPFVSEKSPVVLHDLYEEDKEQLLNLMTGPQDILVGYSLGGRIALEIARRNKFNPACLILLSAHPGLHDDERETRKIWEDSVFEKMSSLPLEEFTRFWDGLDLFNSSSLCRNLEEKKLKKSAQLFDQFRLSKMPCCEDELRLHKDKITWIVGLKDSKYLELAHKRLTSLGVNILTVNADHRVLTAQHEIQDIFRSKDVL